MEIKGTAVKSIKDFVVAKYPNRYNEWFKALPESSKSIMIDTIISSHWYSITEAAIEPTKKIGEVFYGNNIKKGAWESGRYSAEQALNGIYKLYVKMASPSHIIQRASRILPAYYSSGEIDVIDKSEKWVLVKLTKVDKPNEVIEYRIAGWMEKALEISGCQGVLIEIPKSVTKGDAITHFKCSWS